MNATKNKYGEMNAHVVGMALKEIMRRAIEEIWKRRVGFVGSDKFSAYKEDPADRVTDADHASQAIFVKKLEECFPGYGIVAEEQDFRKTCDPAVTGSLGLEVFFTVDPLDGTKAFERRQSHGFGPMLSLCTTCGDGHDCGEVIAAFVGDAMTRELYYYRPESPKVHRLNFGDHQYEELRIDGHRTLASQYVLLRDDPRDLPEKYEGLSGSKKRGGIFKDIEVAGGGIGSGMARLWKGEVGAYVVKGGMQQPWDLMPVWGMSEKLGFVWLYHDGAVWKHRRLQPSMKAVKFAEPSIVIHESRLGEFNEIDLERA